MTDITTSFNKLNLYIEKENFKGYDPYDTLLSWLPFKWFGKWGPVLAIQFQKRNPINIRKFIGIKKDYNPKAIGLFLQAYSILYQKTNEVKYKDKADFLFQWLIENYSKGYSGYCWGYNFPWASSVKYLQPFVPSSVVTGFVCKGLWEYYKIEQNPKAAELIISAANFVLKDLPQYSDSNGLSISYTPIMKDVCYNASLLAGEILSMKYKLTSDLLIKNTCVNLVNFVINKQKENGLWNYSLDIKTGKERKQIDFHQGYIIESIYEIKNRCSIQNNEWDKAIQNGLDFYFSNQFFKEGRSLWRFPKKYPVDIHNQSQGIITFFKLKEYNNLYGPFAKTISEWTINNMQTKRGFFYYRKNNLIDIKIPYMRWSQAWMFLALSNLM